MLRAATSPGAARRVGKRIKWIIVRVLLAFGLGFGATFWYSEHVFGWMMVPAGGLLSPFEGGLPVFTAPTQMFAATMKLAAYGGLTLALPVAVFGFYRLFSPIFTRSQRWIIRIVLPSSALLFVAGIAFVYYVMLPVGLKFLLNFGSGVAIPLIAVTQYLELLTQLMFWMGVIFQLPLIMWVAVKLRAVKYSRLNWLRRVVPFAALILGIILTPGTDLFNMALVAVPIILLYEVGLFLAWAAHTDEGNYMFLRTIGRAVSWFVRKVRAVIWFILWPARVPVYGLRWAYRKVRR